MSVDIEDWGFRLARDLFHFVEVSGIGADLPTFVFHSKFMEFRFCGFAPRAALFDVENGGHEELGWNRFGGRFLLGECGFDEVLTEVPEGAWEFAEIAENVVECGDKAIDLFLADDEGR